MRLSKKTARLLLRFGSAQSAFEFHDRRPLLEDLPPRVGPVVRAGKRLAF